MRHDQPPECYVCARPTMERCGSMPMCFDCMPEPDLVIIPSPPPATHLELPELSGCQFHGCTPGYCTCYAID